MAYTVGECIAAFEKDGTRFDIDNGITQAEDEKAPSAATEQGHK